MWRLARALLVAGTVFMLLILDRGGLQHYLRSRRRMSPPVLARPIHKGPSRTSFSQLLQSRDPDPEPTTPSLTSASAPASLSFSNGSLGSGSAPASRRASLELSVEDLAFLGEGGPAGSGLFEDLRLASLLAVERLSAAVRRARWLPRPRAVLSGLRWTAAACAYACLRLLAGAASALRHGLRWGRAAPAAVRHREALVRQEGYPYERRVVPTRDGYACLLERLPRPGASRVVFLQHGIVDNSFAWLGAGSASLAFRLYDQGCDVWYLQNSSPMRRCSSTDSMLAREFADGSARR